MSSVTVFPCTFRSNARRLGKCCLAVHDQILSPCLKWGRWSLQTVTGCYLRERQVQYSLPIVRAPNGLGLIDTRRVTMIFRNSIEQFGEVMLAVVAVLVPIVALSLFLTT